MRSEEEIRARIEKLEKERKEYEDEDEQLEAEFIAFQIQGLKYALGE